jgi:2,3-dihydroxyphenylpropionate 1,2-dioxygenase
MGTGPTIEVLCASHSPQMAKDVEKREGLRFRAGFARAAAAVHEFDPTLLVYFGPDHMRALAGIAPCFTVVEAATGYGDWDTPKEDYQVPLDRAEALTAHLVERGIDIAVAEHLSLDHGFGQTTADLFGSLSAVPMVPIVVNCVGTPLATLDRTAALGRAVGDYLRTLPADERVLVIASGGISHSPPSLVPGAKKLSEAEREALIADNITKAAEAINRDWDKDILARMAGDSWPSLATLTQAELAPGGTGGAEVRTWVAAQFTGGRPLTTVTYEPVEEWITGMGVAASDRLAPAS